MVMEKRKRPRVIIDGQVIRSEFQDIDSSDDNMEVVEIGMEDLITDDGSDGQDLVDMTTGKTVIKERGGKLIVNESLGIIGGVKNAPGRKAIYRLGEEEDGKTRIRKTKVKSGKEKSKKSSRAEGKKEK